MAESSEARRPMRGLSRWPSRRVSRLVPILTTRRAGRAAGLRLIKKLRFADAHGIARDGALPGQFFFHAHFFKNVLEALQGFLLVETGHRRQTLHFAAR